VPRALIACALANQFRASIPWQAALEEMRVSEINPADSSRIDQLPCRTLHVSAARLETERDIELARGYIGKVHHTLGATMSPRRVRVGLRSGGQCQFPRSLCMSLSGTPSFLEDSRTFTAVRECNQECLRPGTGDVEVLELERPAQLV